jgi:hypothetical protein
MILPIIIESSESVEGNWYYELPEEIKKSVDRGLQDIKENKVTPHADVMKLYQKWLKHK